MMKDIEYEILKKKNSLLESENKRLKLDIENGNKLLIGNQQKSTNQNFNTQILDNIPAGIYLIETKTGSILYANPTFEKMFGYETDELVGKNVSIVNAETKKPAKDVAFDIIQKLEQFDHWEGEVANIKKDGTVFYCEATVSTFEHSLFGTIWIASHKDISERKKIKNALKESEEKFKAYTNQATEGITVSDMEGKYVYVNSAFCKMSGYKREELLKMSVFDMTSKKQKNIIFNDSKGPQQGIPLQAFLIRKDKPDYLTEITGKVITIDTKQFVLGTIRDITERQKTHEALEKSEKKLKELNTTKNKLFSIIAHDLRSPFNTILGFSELLIENVKEFEVAEAEKYLGFINSSAKNTLILLDNLLNWAKSQTGQIKFQPKKINLSSILREVIELKNSYATIKNITIIQKQSDEVEVYADEDLLKTVLRNLISNAIKFTNSGGNINIFKVIKQHQVEITISDNGVGMNNETRKKLFNVSAYETSPGTAKEKGSGLGLVLCKEFVEKLGGNIWVESEEGKGSDFKFTLPLNRSSE